MQYRTIGTDPRTRRRVSTLALGAMLFGTTTDEATAFAVLDRYVEAGGTFVDTSNNYAFWATGSQGGESEAVLARWRAASRGIGDEVVIATKLGARRAAPDTSFAAAASIDAMEGLGHRAVRAQGRAQPREPRRRAPRPAPTPTCDDPGTPLAEQVDGLAGLVEDGTVGMLGASNLWAWELERSRSLARRTADLRGRAVPALRTCAREPTSPGSALARGRRSALPTATLLSWLAGRPER